MKEKKTSKFFVDGLSKKEVVLKKTKHFWRRQRKRKSNWFSWSPALFVLTTALFIFVLALGFAKFNKTENVQAKFELANFIANGKFLVLFLNQTELRGSGGFIGSYADVDIKNGKVTDFNFDTNIYTSDKKLKEKVKVAPPDLIKKYLQLDNWYMRDSNLEIDFEKAAPTIAWFDLQKRNQKENDLDGIVAVDAKVFTDYLKLKGPIKLSDGSVVDDKNFLSLIQYKVEKEYFADKTNWSENEPKKILKELFADLTKNLGTDLLTNGETRKIISQNLAEKHLVFYSFNPDTENEIKKLNWGGTIDAKINNYLMIANTNLSGMKSSANIKEDILYNQNQNQITLTIKRTHNGSYVWPDGENKNYTRILTPLNANLVSATFDGKDVTKQIDKKEEDGKNEFGFWFPLFPKESKTLVLKYQLPENIDSENLLVQKQMGSVGEIIKITNNGQEIYNGDLNKDLKF